MKIRTLVMGGGVIGSAVAYELSQRGETDIHVIDADLKGELSSSERNAGGVRHLWQQSINVELARSTIRFFNAHAKEVGFKKSGYLWLYSQQQKTLADSVLELTAHRKLSYEKLSPAQIQERYPFIDHTDDLYCGLLGKEDGIVNPNAARLFFQTESQKKGVQFHDHLWMKEYKEKTNKVEVSLARFSSDEEAQTHLKNPQLPLKTEETWEVQRLILCLGAWMSPFAPVRPIRRQIALFKSEQFDMSPYGMVVDTSGVYFHPEGGQILSGLVIKDEPAGYNFDYDPHFFEEHIWPALFERSSVLERLKFSTGWAGLYSYTLDTTGILGHVPDTKHVFEAHSFTGRGVMQSYGAAIALCELILEGKFKSFDASVLHRDRFKTNKNFLKEELHI